MRKTNAHIFEQEMLTSIMSTLYFNHMRVNSLHFNRSGNELGRTWLCKA